MDSFVYDRVPYPTGQEELVRELGKTTESQAGAADAPDAVTIATRLQRLAQLGVLLK